MSTVTLSFDNDDTKPTYPLPVLKRTLTAPIGGPPDPATLDRHRCDHCGDPITYGHTEVAVLVSRALWGYVHDGCLDALKAARR